jgi:hypothetical protein
MGWNHTAHNLQPVVLNLVEMMQYLPEMPCSR